MLKKCPYCKGAGEIDLDARRAKLNCACGNVIEPYMIKHTIWQSLGYSSSDNKCLMCTEKRIKEVFNRGFLLSDFADVPLNGLLFLAAKLPKSEG
jgi:hypothetical protein